MSGRSECSTSQVVNEKVPSKVFEFTFHPTLWYGIVDSWTITERLLNCNVMLSKMKMIGTRKNPT